MSTVTLPSSALDVQVEGLMQRIVRDRDERCAALRRAAAAQGKDIVASARRDALAKVRGAIAEERERIEQGLRLAEARADTEARRQAQRETQALLEHLWAEIPSLLEQRWHDPKGQQGWISAAFAHAGTLLAGRPWRIEHAPLRASQATLGAEALERGAREVLWVLDATLSAGLKIVTESVRLDATPSGLLADREQIEAQFLAEYAACLAKPAVLPAEEHAPHA